MKAAEGHQHICRIELCGLFLELAYLLEIKEQLAAGTIVDGHI